MIRSMYSGVSGMKAFQAKMDVIGNNIANVNTVGFKKSRVTFEDVLSQTVGSPTAGQAGTNGGVNPKQIGLGAGIAAITVLHTPGSPMTTNVPSDLMINGDGFFKVQPTSGSETYLTRAGDFSKDAAGNLVTSDGFLVLDNNGSPIQLNSTTVSYSVGTDGTISEVDNSGNTTSTKKIGLYKVANPEGLEKIGGSLYKTSINSGTDTAVDLSTDKSSQILSGQLEMSNVDLTDEMTDMIIAQRGFQANSRVITTSDSMLQEVVDLKRQ
jgi:flagellar hook protein FlgE